MPLKSRVFMPLASIKELITYTQRLLACALLLLCVMPVTQAEAATKTLSETLWTATGFCLAESSHTEPVEVMTPDARAYQMSIELRALREMLRTQPSPDELVASAPIASPCVEDAGTPALCVPVAEPVADEPRFVAASLLEDIAPLEAPESPRSCNASSSGPDRCESYPAHPQRLHLDVTLSSAVLRASLTLSVHQDDRSRTLPLVRALPSHLLDAAPGHTLDDERPPDVV